MDKIIQKLYQGDTAEFIHELLTVYKVQGHATVNFLYFANAMQFHLFETHRQTQKDENYQTALLDGDFLLPDGIALQLRSKFTEKKSLSNLNGTDLTPEVLSYLNTHHSQGKVSLYIYSLYDPKINKGKERLEKAIQKLSKQYDNINIQFSHQSLYSQRGGDFPWKSLEEHLSSDKSEIKVFLNCTGTPFQELWTAENKDFFSKNSILLMNVGGFIDFVAGFEKRAPKWVVKARVLETFRRISTNPGKNLKKFLAMFGIRRILLQKMLLKK